LKEKNNILFLDIVEEKLGVINLETKDSEFISPDLKLFESLYDIIWSPEAKQVFFKIIYNDSFNKWGGFFWESKIKEGENTIWHFDLNENKPKILQNNIVDLLWLSESQIMYIYQENNKSKSLYKSNPQLTNQQKLFNLPNEAFELLNYNRQTNILYYSRSIQSIGGGFDIYKLNLNTGKEEKILGGIRQIFISPDQRFIVYGKYEEDDQTYLLKVDGNQINKMDFIPNECIFYIKDNKPHALLSGLKKNDPLLGMIDLNEGKIIKYIYSNKDIKFYENLILSRDGKALYFTSDDYLYKMEIAE